MLLVPSLPIEVSTLVTRIMD